MKLDRKPGAKGHDWGIDPDYEDMFDHGSFLRRRYRFKNGIKKDKNASRQNLPENLGNPLLSFGSALDYTSTLNINRELASQVVQEKGFAGNMNREYSYMTENANNTWNTLQSSVSVQPGKYEEPLSPLSPHDMSQSSSDCMSSPESSHQTSVQEYLHYMTHCGNQYNQTSSYADRTQGTVESYFPPPTYPVYMWRNYAEQIGNYNTGNQQYMQHLQNQGLWAVQ